ncbi:peptidase [Roseibium sp. TrichSKD4]|uniref:M48 family metalloprotease n=1 Tax=Roseibium sp. TrichSKD4 TaxID=744980 RepID=UPI0001E56922|nr:M48 family metalloprotease [Roseibium sp. TrichSKD4]EFO32450.1 peptidase [Roseibium sp. TrichSKD4]
MSALAKSGDKTALRRRLKIGIAVLLCGALTACQLMGNGPNVGTVAPGTLRPNLAADIGAREHPRVVATYGGVYKDPGAERAVASVVGRLVEASEDPSQSYRITILNSPAINAFALPGGYLYVTRGLLALANDTSELAAVLAHEMAHVTANHAIKRQQRAEARELADKILTNVVRDDEQARAAIASSELSFARFSQVQELEADEIGVRTLAKAGFDPYAAARFLKSMATFAAYQRAQDASSSAPDFLSSHPSTPERLAIATQSARKIGTPGVGERDRKRYLTSLDGMLYGDDPAEGFIRGRTFLHKSLGIGYTVPSGYILENSPEAVLASNSAGTAIRFDGANLSKFKSLRDYMTSGWINGLLPQSIQETTVNGLPGIVGSAATQGWSFRIAVLRIGKTGYRFIFASRAPNAAFEQQFQETIRSFRQLSPTDRARLQPLRIKIVTSKPGDTPRKVAVNMQGVEASRRLKFFSVLNGLDPNRAIPPGTALKIVTD